VVKLSTAGAGVEDTGGVGLERALVSLDGDGEDGALEGSLHLGGVVSGDVFVALGLNAGVGLAAVGAGAVTGGVLPVGGKGGVMGLVVLVGLVLPATTATVAGGVAGDELLLGEVVEGTVSNSPLGLESAVSGERPAGAALALILDGVDVTEGNPVNGGASGSNLGDVLVVLVLLGHGLVGKEC